MGTSEKRLCEYYVSILWALCWYSVGILWVFCGYSVCILCVCCGYSVSILWVFCWYFVIILWVFFEYFVQIGDEKGGCNIQVGLQKKKTYPGPSANIHRKHVSVCILWIFCKYYVCILQKHSQNGLRPGYVFFSGGQRKSCTLPVFFDLWTYVFRMLT